MDEAPAIIVDKCMRPVARGAPKSHFFGWQDSGTEGGLRSRARRAAAVQAGVVISSQAFCPSLLVCWADLGQSCCGCFALLVPIRVVVVLLAGQTWLFCLYLCPSCR